MNPLRDRPALERARAEFARLPKLAEGFVFKPDDPRLVALQAFSTLALAEAIVELAETWGRMKLPKILGG